MGDFMEGKVAAVTGSGGPLTSEEVEQQMPGTLLAGYNRRCERL